MENFFLWAFIIALLILWGLVDEYNGNTKELNSVRHKWAKIEIQLKRRHDLISRLEGCVAGYAQHEKRTLESVARARLGASAALNVSESARAEASLTSALKSLYAVVEAYPTLKANENFLALQRELSSTENLIMSARTEYNDSVLSFNNRIQTFPENIAAKVLGFYPKAFFKE